MRTLRAQQDQGTPFKLLHYTVASRNQRETKEISNIFSLEDSERM